MIRKAWFCQECRVIMTYDEKKDFYKCPECGTEVWPETKEKQQNEIHNFMQEMAPSHHTIIPLPAGDPTPGGSHSSKSRSKSERMKKASTTTMYKKLFVES